MPLLSLVLSNMTAVAVAATVVVAFTILILFRKNIRGAIDRWNVQPPLAPAQQIAPSQNDVTQQQSFINLKPDNAEARQRAAELTKILDNSSHTIDQKLQLALIDLANKDLRLEYEIIYRSIYGSQLEALRSLLQAGPHPLIKYHLTFLDRVKTAYIEPPPQQTTDFESWVAYLTKREHPLILLEGGVASITRTGSEFLSYVASFVSPQSPPPRGL